MRGQRPLHPPRFFLINDSQVPRRRKASRINAPDAKMMSGPMRSHDAVRMKWIANGILR